MSSANQPAAPTAVIDDSAEVIDRLLNLPEDVKIDLANLLLDSVRQGFTSLDIAQKRDKELIRSRLESMAKGEVELVDATELIAGLKSRYDREHPK